MPTTLATKLARFMKANKLKPLALAAEAGISRQQLYRIRAGTADLRIMTAMRIRDACGRLLTRRVSVDELFDSSDPQAQRMRR
jgi:transcriptional regulator with XRE-family HTH domain